MLWTYSTNCFPDGYVPTVLDKYTVDLPVGKDVYKLILFDTAGQEEYDRLRIMTYPNTDVVLICFSVVEPESLENVQSVWYPEVKKYLPNTPFVLVGTKIDLRYNIDEIKRLKLQKREPVSYDTAMQIAQKMGAIGYVECSALTQKASRMCSILPLQQL